MKLIRWVEVHIGRSRRKSKKEQRTKDGVVAKDETLPHVLTWAPDDGDSVSGSPLPEVRKIDGDLIEGKDRRTLHIRTSFLEASSMQQEAVSSPRQRSRIRTNPWLPSPRSSCSSTSSGDSGWSGTRSSGSDSPETSGESVFGSQSSAASHWSGWTSVSSLRSARELGGVTLPLRERGTHDSRHVASLERRRKVNFWAERLPQTDPRSRSLPRGVEWEYQLTDTTKICPLAEGDSSEAEDEAYSEDFVQSQDEESSSAHRTSFVPQTTSPQADSACGSDREQSSSCGSTPLTEEIVTCGGENLDDKVRRLRVERVLVEEKMREAREEDQRRREERMVCQQEMLHFRRLLLIRTLQELRTRLELQGERLHRAYGATLEMRSECNYDDEWPRALDGEAHY